ncbi:hypothetical protein [Pseudoalteromonas phage vB_PalP_Y7]|nr:hypothetical protein [Pseudoalteromonas phage vB_PalP_Y7]
MRYTISINQVKTREWGLNMNEGALMDLINQAYSWAEPVMIEGNLYYWMSRNKVIAEIPTAYSKPDTVYRAFRTLAQKGLVLYTKQGKRDLLALTAKGKKWNVEGTAIGDAILGYKSDLIGNSEIDPSKSGNKSENYSDRNPTYKNTSINKSTNNKRERSAPENLIATAEQIDLLTKYNLIEDIDLMISSFLANGKSKGLEYDCWSSAFTVWINREIKIKNATRVTDRPMIDTRSNQQSGYHPSQSEFQQPSATSPAMGDPNWHWKEPLPGMSVPETEKFLKANKRAGENNNKAYQRIYAEMQEQGL